MYPGFAFWQARRAAACGEGGCGGDARAEWGPGAARAGWRAGWGGHHHHAGPHGGGEDSDFGGGAFGVRRPLRFLAYKLDLSEEQVGKLASVLDDLKTERAQAAVDHRRTTAAFADAVAHESFDASAVSEAANARVQSAERLKSAVVGALGKIHAILDAEQRAKLSYLLRTGALSI